VNIKTMASEQLQYPPCVATTSDVEDDVCDVQDVEAGEIKDCSICLDEMDKPNETGTLVCGHTLHKKCANQYFRGLYISNLDITCPLCRKVLQDTTSVEYILRRLSILGTIPNSLRPHMTPPHRGTLPQYTDTCFAKSILSIPMVVLVVFIIMTLVWTRR
jgi:hypothetical protein